MMNVCCGEAGLCFLLNALHLISNRQGLSDGWMEEQVKRSVGLMKRRALGFHNEVLASLIRMIYTALCVQWL